MENVVKLRDTLSYGYLYNPQFNKALQQIATAKLHGQFLSNVVKFMRNYDKHFTDLKKQYTALAKQYAELDEQGDLKMDEKGNFNIIKGKDQEWLAAVDTLMEKSFPIKKLPYQNLVSEGVKLSPVDISILEPILDGLEDS